MFSHTHKGQDYNMELLSKFLNPSSTNTNESKPDPKRPRLIDYELLTGGDGKRTVGFGWFAGGEYAQSTYQRLFQTCFLRFQLQEHSSLCQLSRMLFWREALRLRSW